MKTKLLRLLIAMTISITALFALGLSAGAATAGDLTITLTDGGEPTVDTDYTYADNVLTIKSDTPMTISGTSTNDIIFIDSGVDANLTLDNLSIDASSGSWRSAFEIGSDSTGDVTITLVGDNKLKSGFGYAGLQKSNTEYSDELGMLTIKGTGSLTATGGYRGAGIGGGDEGSGSNITIEGGTVIAQGGENGAGIGGGEGNADGTAGHGEYITIRGNAIVNATGGSDEDGGGAGIGGGGIIIDPNCCKGGNGSHIKISENAQVTATGGYCGAGIGGGNQGSGNNITIEGGTVIAKGGENGAGIGGGEGDNDGTVGHGEYITIRGNAIVNATGGEDGAGIGGGFQGRGNNITIEGGTVTAKGGVGGAGIGGGGNKGTGSYITISGGTITATGGQNSAGIGGGGSKSNGSYITISGGTVTAQGGTYSAGIGGGYRGSADNIKISGGTVKAVAGVGDEKNGTTYFPAAIGQGVQYNESTRLYSDGAEVTPTDGTNNAYLLELDVDGTSAVTINGKAYPTKHIDENKLYVYFPAGYYTVANGNSQKIYTIADDGTVSEVVVGTAFTVTGTDLVYGTDYTYPTSTGVLTILSGKAITIANADTTTATTNTIIVADGVSANITLAGVNIDVSGTEYAAAFQIAENSIGNVTITLADDTTNTLKSGKNCAALQKNGGYISEDQGKLIITGNGTLNAEGCAAGIGGGKGKNSANIEIKGGKINALSRNDSHILYDGTKYGSGGAGIGGGGAGNGSYITISGGEVTATGSTNSAASGGAGIGGGYSYSGSNITISGGTVKAQGGDMAAGIGGGRSGSGSYITISGGTVTAEGGYDSAGIGGGYGGGADNIEISGGKVTATGDGCGAGIGGGYKGNGSNITISGGEVIATSKGSGAGIGGGHSGSGSNIKISGGVVIATSEGSGAGIGGGYKGSADNITISGGSVKAVAGKGYEEDGTTYLPAAIGQGVQYDGVYSNGAEVTPTDGTDNVYLLELDVDGTSAVTANGNTNYPKKHFDENKVYIYLPAKTAQTPNEVTIGTETTKYCYDTVNEKWLKVVEAPAADETEFVYNGKEQTYALAESDYYTISDNIAQTNAGTYTVTVALKENFVWSDNTTNDKTYDFVIGKAPVTIKSKNYSVTEGDPLYSFDYDVEGLVNGEKLPIDVTITCKADGKTAGTYDIIVSGDAESDNYKFTYVKGTLTVYEKEAISAPVITATPGNGQVVLKWNAVKGAEKYRVYYYVNNKYTLVGDTATTTKTVTGLTNGTKYGFLVRAYANGEWTAYTKADLVYATPVAPAAVKPVVTAAAGDGKAVLKWNAVSGAAKYNVYYYVDGRYYSVGSTTRTSINVNNLTNGTKYGFLVRAYVNGKWTAYTKADNVYATPSGTTTAKPVLSITTSSKSAKLTWTSVKGATKYSVYYYADKKYTLSGTATTRNFTVTGLTNGKKYGFLVRAYVSGKWTSFTSADVVFATPVSAAKPVVTATRGSKQVTLTWNAVAGATKYRVYYYLNGKYTAVETKTDTTSIVKNLTSGTKYGFLVRAYVDGKWTTYTSADLVYVVPNA